MLSVLLIAVVLVGGTLAYLVAEGDLVVNSFALAEVNTEIEEPEDNDNASAKTPYVESSGTSKVYVRARAVVVTRADSPVPVTENDMTIRYNKTANFADSGFGGKQNNWWTDTGAYWKPNGDGWYYYTAALNKGIKPSPCSTALRASRRTRARCSTSTSTTRACWQAPTQTARTRSTDPRQPGAKLNDR